MIIALDGPAGSGKSTIAAAVARRLGVAHVDTGAMYRALALKILESTVDPGDQDAVSAVLPGTGIEVRDGSVLLDGRDVGGLIRTAPVGAAASLLAEHEPVRKWMVELQRRVILRAPGGAVVEGRDIGTVVLPDADLKVYLTASEHERARRRAGQRGISAEEALKEVSSRDARDTGRRHSPLKVAEDSAVIDNTGLDVEETVDAVLRALAEARVR